MSVVSVLGLPPLAPLTDRDQVVAPREDDARRVLPELECVSVRSSCGERLRVNRCGGTREGRRAHWHFHSPIHAPPPWSRPARDATASAGARTGTRCRHLVRVLRRLGGHLVYGLELERTARPAHKSVARVGLLAGARRDRGEAADVGRPKGPQPQHPPLLLAAPLRRGASAAGGFPRPVRVARHAANRSQAPGPSSYNRRPFLNKLFVSPVVANLEFAKFVRARIIEKGASDGRGARPAAAQSHAAAAVRRRLDVQNHARACDGLAPGTRSWGV